MHKKYNPTWEHIKLFIWVILIFELLNIYDFPELKMILKGANHIDVKVVKGTVSLPEFLASMLSYSPPWLVFLYRIRKIFVTLLGMTQDESIDILQPLKAEDVPFQPGKTATFFTVRYAKQDRCWIAETPDDKHLKAFFGIFVERIDTNRKRYHVMTVVHYKHWTGPLYFNAIRPFHHLVVKRMALAGVR